MEQSAFTQGWINDCRITRVEAIADNAFMAQEDADLPMPDGQTIKRLLILTDHAAALRMNAQRTATVKRRRLTEVQWAALEWLEDLAANEATVNWADRPGTNTLVALIDRGLVTAARSGRIQDHKLTDAGWTALGL